MSILLQSMRGVPQNLPIVLAENRLAVLKIFYSEFLERGVLFCRQFAASLEEFPVFAYHENKLAKNLFFLLRKRLRTAINFSSEFA